MTRTLLLTALLVPFTALGQLSENFSDGDFTTAPQWIGNAADWTVNTGKQLQSTNTTASSTFFLATPNTLAVATEWEFYIRLSFNTSSQNYVDVFLTATGSDLASSATNGYFVRIGHTDDEVALYRKDGATSTRIIDGADGTTNSSNNILKIKVVRTASHSFLLYRDDDARGNYAIEGSVTDATYTASGFFGVLVKQSTASFFGRHYVDDITIRPFTPDATPPTVKAARATSPTTLDVLFSEPVELASGSALANYAVNNNIGNPATAQRDAGNSGLLHLSFSKPFSNGVLYTLQVSAVKDLAGNTLTAGAANFSYYTPEAKDVVVNEILFNPKTGGEDYVELYNRSSKVVDLSKLSLANRSGSGTIASVKSLSDTARYLLPGEYVVITPNAAVLGLQYFIQNPGAVHTIPSLPSYPNEKGAVVLTSSTVEVIDEVAYSEDWHFALIVNKDGVSLERLDPEAVSGDSQNWHSAASGAGYGTPGYKNSQFRLADAGEAVLEVTPRLFSPDNDGQDDMATIQYTLPGPGYAGTIIIFNAAGREVRRLARNAVLGTKGNFTWDGLGEKREQLPIGTYIIYAEFFNLQGKKKQAKKTVVLGRRM